MRLMPCIERGWTLMCDRNALYLKVKQELERYEKRGVVISLEGEPVRAKKAARISCYETEACYMRDYIIDDSGNIIEIGFNRVDY